MKAWFHHFPDAFTPEECAAIVEFAPAFPEQSGTVGHGAGHRVNATLRTSQVRWLPRAEPALRFLFDRMTLCILEANARSFFLALDYEPRLSYTAAQFTTYRAEDEGHYDWHEDNCWVPAHWRASDRKLSAVLLLSDLSTFTGGEFEIDRVTAPLLTQGSVIVFPSHARHRVLPVKSGLRNSLVLWAEGPRLR